MKQIPKIANSGVFIAYKELTHNSWLHYALTLNIISSLTIDQFILYIQTYEGINSDREISYWDYTSEFFCYKTNAKWTTKWHKLL